MIKDESGRAPYDHRSDVNNPTSSDYKAAQGHDANINNPAYGEHQAAMDNKEIQVNPNNPPHRSSKKKGTAEEKKWPDLTDWALKRRWQEELF